MAKSDKTRIFKGRSLTDALVKAKNSMGPNISIVNRRDVTEENLFSKLTSGKLGGATLSVELEVAMAPPEQPREEKPRPHTPTVGVHQLVKSYSMARENNEKHDSDAKQAMTAAAAPHVSVGETATGIAGRLDEVRQEVAASRKESAELWDKVQMIVSLQARGGVPSVAPKFLDCYRRLTAADVSETLAREIVESLQLEVPGAESQEEIEQALLGEIARRIPAAGPLLPGDDKPLVVALVGASGVGKSTSISKLALEFAVKRGRSVGVINEDMRRPGAESQINNLSRLFGISVVTALRPDEIRDVVRSMSGRDFVFIDTGGRSPRDEKGIRRLAEIIKAAGTNETHLLLSSVTSEKEMRHTVELYKPTGFDRVILTKLDECASYGSVLNVGTDLASGFSYITTGPNYTRPIEPADRMYLAEVVLGRKRIEAGSEEESPEGDVR